MLAEVTKHLGEDRGLKFPNEKFQLFVDGGVRRATDVLKAIALGATAGKSFLTATLESHSCLLCMFYVSGSWASIPVRVLIIRC